MLRETEMRQETVIFLHLPKTAGSTLNWIIQRQYEPAAIYAFRWYFHWSLLPTDEFKQLPTAQKEKIRFITGHMSFGLHEAMSGSYTYITVLRNPVDRVISSYYHILRDRKHPIHNEVISMSLPQYLCSGLSLDANNGQTRRLSGVGTTVPYGQCSSQMLEQAKQNIQEHFSIVGLTERFDETLILLKRHFGWKNPFYLTQNKGRNQPAREDISPDGPDLIKQYNQLDIELYQYAQEMFDAQIRQQDVSFEQEVKRFKWLNNSFFKGYIFPNRVITKLKWLRKKRLAK